MSDASSIAAKILGAAPRALVPDEIAGLAEPTVWHCVPEWESMGDQELASSSGLLTLESEDSLVVITEAAFTKNRGPFVVAKDELPDLIAEHREITGEPFFDGDVVVMDRRGDTIWLFHHEAAFAVVRRKT